MDIFLNARQSDIGRRRHSMQRSRRWRQSCHVTSETHSGPPQGDRRLAQAAQATGDRQVALVRIPDLQPALARVSAFGGFRVV
jgi:hypothetical protein